MQLSKHDVTHVSNLIIHQNSHKEKTNKTKLMATAETPAEVSLPEDQEIAKGEFTIITQPRWSS